MANDPWEDLIAFGNTVEGDAALAPDSAPQDEFAGMVDFSAQPAPQQAPPQNPREALFMPQRQGVQPTGPRPFGALFGPKNKYQAYQQMFKATPAALAENLASDYSGIEAESYSFDPQGFVTLRYPNGESSTWSITDDHIPDALVGEFTKEYGGLPVDQEGNPVTPVIGMKPRDYELIGAPMPAEAIDKLRERNLFSEDVDAFARGAANAIGVDDEIDAIVGSLVYGDDFTESLRRSRAIRDYDEKENSWARTAGTITGSLLLPSKASGVARPAAKEAFTATFRAALVNGADQATARALARDAAGEAARRAVTGQIAKEGALYGGAYGVGSGDTLAERGLGGATGSAEGSAFGGLVGAAGTQARRFMPQRAPQPLNDAQQAYTAAQRQGIEMFPPDLGGAMTQRITGGVAQTPFGAGPITRAAERSIETGQAARDRIASSAGTPLNSESLGDQVAAGLRQSLDDSRAAIGREYESIGNAAANTRIVPTKALEAADRNITELSEVPGGSMLLPTLRSIRDDLAKGDHSIGAIRQMRSTLRDQFRRDNLIGTDIERRVNQVIDAAQDDIVDGLNNTGRNAEAGRIASANRAWRQLKQDEENLVVPLTGTRDKPKSGGAIARSLQADLQGNSGRAARMLRMLPDDVAGNVRASVIAGLGRGKAGAQNAEGEGFSFNTFLTNWNDISPKVKAAYFTPEMRSALDDVAKVAERVKLRGSQRFANTSGTAGALEANRMFTYLTALPSLGATVGGQYALGRMMASSRFAKWLVALPKKPNGEAVRAHIKRLGKFGTSGGIQAQEYLDLSDQLLQDLDATNGEQR